MTCSVQTQSYEKIKTFICDTTDYVFKNMDFIVSFLDENEDAITLRLNSVPNPPITEYSGVGFGTFICTNLYIQQKSGMLMKKNIGIE